jgi:transposase
VRVPDGYGGRHAEIRRFTTTTEDLYVVAEWLASQLPGDPCGDGVDRVLLEAGLAPPRGPGECWLLNAAHMHNVPGRNADDADAAWIADLVEQGRPVSYAATPPKAGRNVPFDPLCAATSYAPGKRTACRDTQ